MSVKEIGMNDFHIGAVTGSMDAVNTIHVCNHEYLMSIRGNEILYYTSANMYSHKSKEMIYIPQNMQVMKPLHMAPNSKPVSIYISHEVSCEQFSAIFLRYETTVALMANWQHNDTR